MVQHKSKDLAKKLVRTMYYSMVSLLSLEGKSTKFHSAKTSVNLEYLCTLYHAMSHNGGACFCLSMARY